MAVNLEEFFDYKNTLVYELCNSENVVKLLRGTGDVSVPDASLAYSQIFPFEYTPETTESATTYICCDVDVLSANKTYYDIVLYIWVYTHKSKLRLSEGGVLTDALAKEIDKILNGNRFFGLGSLDLSNVARFSPLVDYQGRVLAYRANDFNLTSSTQEVPSRRKSR